jgi:hypothetical protein
MHYTAGLILSIVFQLVHADETTNPAPNEVEKWKILKIHQLCIPKQIVIGLLVV